MRTYTHGIIGYLIYLKGSLYQKQLAVLGAMLPDFFLAVGYIFHYTGDSLLVQKLHNLFHHSLLHSITEYMHSFFFILFLMILAHFFYKSAMPFYVGMFSHALVDFFTHQRSSYNHFLPIPLEHIGGIVSYTSLWFTILEHSLIVLFVLWILKRKRDQSKV